MRFLTALLLCSVSSRGFAMGGEQFAEGVLVLFGLLLGLAFFMAVAGVPSFAYLLFHKHWRLVAIAAGFGALSGSVAWGLLHKFGDAALVVSAFTFVCVTFAICLVIKIYIRIRTSAAQREIDRQQP